VVPTRRCPRRDRVRAAPQRLVGPRRGPNVRPVHHLATGSPFPPRLAWAVPDPVPPRVPSGPAAPAGVAGPSLPVRVPVPVRAPARVRVDAAGLSLPVRSLARADVDVAGPSLRRRAPGRASGGRAAGGRAVVVGLLAAGAVLGGELLQARPSEADAAVAPAVAQVRSVPEPDSRADDEAAMHARAGAGGRDLDAVRGDQLRWARERVVPEQRVDEPAADAVWDLLAACESGGVWDVATGNGYFGGLQFDEQTWRSYGGTEYADRADQASREQQIAVAVRVRADRGDFGAWPTCARALGLPGSSDGPQSSAVPRPGGGLVPQRGAR